MYKKMQDALAKNTSCASVCENKCDESGSSDTSCGGEGCPFEKNPNQVYNVYYFSVEYDFDDQSSSGPSSVPESSNYKYCSSDCPSMKSSQKTFCSKSLCSSVTDKKEKEDTKCQMPVCPDKNSNFIRSPADSDISLDFASIHNPCCVKTCDVADKVKDFIVDGVMSKKNKSIADGENTCYCDCVCSFKFTKNTTYCAVCGGYECLGDDMKEQPEYAKPHPCPVYHKLYDKNYIKVADPWPEEEPKKQTDTISMKSAKGGGTKVGSSAEKRIPSSRSMKSLIERKRDKKEVVEKAKNINRKKRSIRVHRKKPEPKKYPYPQVPKNMGWNWVAEDIPGLKPRPQWKPGAVNKVLVRRYRAIRGGVDIIAKKKRALLQRKKKIELKPTLIVKKRDGEYTVQMEVFKKYSKERLLFQYPYDDKLPIMYTIGKTEEEKLKIQKQRERKERREIRRKRRLLQSTFKDKCQEICLKAYNQAIGLLPLPNPNDPECPCATAPIQNASPSIESCVCSDEGSISSSDTDGDEWVIEFSPPAAKWNPKAKHPPVLCDNESQYSYLDYKVKLLDKRGNPVVRFFKGPDGKQECSDLGGFWGPNHVWLEINKDGYIGPDNRWVPTNFIGPDGLLYSAEDGTFTNSTGQVLKIGVDGYIDKDGKWAWYSRKIGVRSNFTSSTMDIKKGAKVTKVQPVSKGKTDIKVSTVPLAPAKDKNFKKMPVLVLVKGITADKVKKTVSHSSKGKSPLIMNLSVNYNRSNSPPKFQGLGNIDHKKLSKYQEIMHGLQMYDDLGHMKPPMKTNRASNTPGKQISPFTMYEKSRNKQNLRVVGSHANKTMNSSRTGSTTK